jgi:hypothetical protein
MKTNLKPPITLAIVCLAVLAIALPGAMLVQAAVARPTLIEPVNNHATFEVRPLFSWGHVTGADRYALEVRDNATSDLVTRASYDAAVRCDADTCQVPSPEDLPLGVYKWRVRAFIGDEASDFSIYHVLTVGENAFEKPRLRSPGVDATVYGGRPTFKWYKIESGDTSLITRANVELVDAAYNPVGYWSSTVVNDACSPYCEYRIPLNLSTDYGDYYWRIQVTNDDSTKLSEFSDWRKFTYTRLDRVTAYTPEDGTSTMESRPTFTWSTVPGATYYIFNIRDTADNIITWDLVSASTCGSDVCEAQPSVSLPAGDYKWHIRSKNGINYGMWTPYWNLNVRDGNLITFNFDSDPTAQGWHNPQGRFQQVNLPPSVYRGSESTCEENYNCATTYYGVSFNNAVYTTNMRSIDSGYDVGFSLFFRAGYDQNHDLLRGYSVEVRQALTGIECVFWKWVDGQKDTHLDTVTYSGGGDVPNLQDWHEFMLDLQDNTVVFKVNGDTLLTLTELDPAYSSGVFGVDVISYDFTSHLVDMDWATIYTED